MLSCLRRIRPGAGPKDGVEAGRGRSARRPREGASDPRALVAARREQPRAQHHDEHEERKPAEVPRPETDRERERGERAIDARSTNR